jgi:hypothetical protein
MVNKQPNITHLKQGKVYPNPVHTAKVQGVGYANTAKETTITPTPDSTPHSGADGKLGQKNSPNRP